MAITLVSPQSSAAWFTPITPIAPVSRSTTGPDDSCGETDASQTAAAPVKAAPAPGTGLLVDVQV